MTLRKNMNNFTRNSMPTSVRAQHAIGFTSVEGIVEDCSTTKGGGNSEEKESGTYRLQDGLEIDPRPGNASLDVLRAHFAGSMYF